MLRHARLKLYLCTLAVMSATVVLAQNAPGPGLLRPALLAEKAPARPVNRPPEYSNFDGEGFPAMRPVWGVKPKLSLKVRSR